MAPRSLQVVVVDHIVGNSNKFFSNQRLIPYKVLRDEPLANYRGGGGGYHLSTRQTIFLTVFSWQTIFFK